jgi:hypothetical protein
MAQLLSPLLLWRYGCRHGRMTGVTSRQGVVSVPLLTVHGHVHHVDGASTLVGGPCGSPSCLGGSTCPSGDVEMRRGGQASLMTPRGLGRDEEMLPETHIMPEASPQGSDEIEFVVRALNG